MTFKNLVLVIVSTFLLVLNQIELKLWLKNKEVNPWPLSLRLFKSLFSIEILICIISILISGIIWIYLLKRIDFSLLYPMISISYIFGLVAAIVIFHEPVPILRWIGVGVIIFGIFLVSQK